MGKEHLQGALDLLILKTLQRGAMHGYGIMQRIQQISENALRVEEGSLYPALHRIEQAGWISAEWRATESRRRAKYYSLTTAGARQLAREEKNWDRVSSAVAKVLRFA
jgi:PadR family transcriptional regulator